MYLIDFSFEREIPEETGPKTLKSGIKVGEHEPQPPAKKAKANQTSEP